MPYLLFKKYAYWQIFWNHTEEEVLGYKMNKFSSRLVHWFLQNYKNFPFSSFSVVIKILFWCNIKLVWNLICWSCWIKFFNFLSRINLQTSPNQPPPLNATCQVTILYIDSWPNVKNVQWGSEIYTGSVFKWSIVV